MEFSEGDERIAAGRVEAAPARKGLSHLRWELEQVMTRVGPSDLSAGEISALLAVLRPAHTRVVCGTVGRPRLYIVADPMEEAGSSP